MIKISKAELAGTVTKKNQYPPPLALDIVLAGRSNVGKSSLINRLINRKKLARTSSGPGRTRTVNFYIINDGWYFVDLPGYGYAKVSQTERENFRVMVDEYLATPRRRVVWQIVDLRHPPTALDQQMHDYLLGTGVPYLVVATKADKLSKNEVVRQRGVIRRELGLRDDELVAFSAETGAGKEELLTRIETMLAEEGDFNV